MNSYNLYTYVLKYIFQRSNLFRVYNCFIFLWLVIFLTNEKLETRNEKLETRNEKWGTRD